MSKLSPELFHWLLQALELETSVFHVGQYCGAWTASTSGHGRAAFHLVAHGSCWLHQPGCEPVLLKRGDAVFMLQDTPHALSPEPVLPREDARVRVEMTPLTVPRPGSTGLVCGFFSFKHGVSELIVRSLPLTLLVRADEPELAGLRSVFELILAETERDDGSSDAMIERLTSLLFSYLIRQRVTQDESPVGLFAAARRSEFVGLLQRLIAAPEHAWKLSEMARHSGMSRASFFKNFSQAAGCSPGQFLLALRMQAAGRLLGQGKNIEQVAENVGYQSTAAFARAFKKYTGQQPGAYRRGALRAASG
jgi:AraC family transcriptional regulator, activator of mtrCDE